MVLALIAATGLHAQERADCRVYHSKVLESGVPYCALLPASYSRPESQNRKYAVLYLLHGLGGTNQGVIVDGQWNLLQDLRRDNKVGDFIVVSPQAWDTFYINSRDGSMRYGDFFLTEFIPFIERTYRVKPGRASRGITGVSMGGYGALRTAFARPDLFGSVSAHSAAIVRDAPGPSKRLVSPGDMATSVFGKTFGEPIDPKFWNANSPWVLARQNAAALRSVKIYFDCGTEDVYGLFQGARQLDAALTSLRIPHEFHLYPGGHDRAYFLAHSEATFEFHWRVFNAGQ